MSAKHHSSNRFILSRGEICLEASRRINAKAAAVATLNRTSEWVSSLISSTEAHTEFLSSSAQQATCGETISEGMLSPTSLYSDSDIADDSLHDPDFTPSEESDESTESDVEEEHISEPSTNRREIV